MAPEKVENVYIRSQLIAQLFVHGESLKSCVVAVVVPDVEVLKAWATKNNVPRHALGALSERPGEEAHTGRHEQTGQGGEPQEVRTGTG